jgi:thioredoxin-related protein
MHQLALAKRSHKMKRLEAATYIVLLIVCTMFAVRLWQYHAAPQTDVKALSTPPITNVSKQLPFDLSRHKKWVVFALSTQCHFCSESLPFYRDIQTTPMNDVGLVAVFPQSQTEVDIYERSKGFSPTTLYGYSLAKLQVRGTPTLFLINEKGDVLKRWIGTLSSDDKAELLRQLKS